MAESFQHPNNTGGYDHQRGREPMKDNRVLGLIDLDRCLLDTDAYTEELISHAARILGPQIDAESEMREIREKRGYYVPVFGGEGTQDAYSFEHHLRSMLARLQDVDLTQIENSAVQSIRSQVKTSFPDATHFLYPGATEMLAEISQAADPRIITFGNQQDQIDKLERLPTLARIPAEIIQEDKAGFITRTFQAYPRVYLADDRDYTDIPDNCYAIQVDHTGTLDKSKSGIPVAHSLQEAARFIVESEKRRSAIAA